MTTWTVRARGTATADTVWGRYADTRLWSQWSPQIRSVTTSSGPMLEVGMTGKVRSIAGPGVRFQVDAVDAEARTWQWTVRFGPIRMRLVHGVDPDGGTWLRVTGPLPVLVGYLPVARFALGKLVKA